jgi:hypothetical protein
MPHSIKKLSQHLHVEYLSNSSPIKLKVDENPDVEKAGQHCFDLGNDICASLVWGNSLITTPCMVFAQLEISVVQYTISHSLFHHTAPFQRLEKVDYT